MPQRFRDVFSCTFRHVLIRLRKFSRDKPAVVVREAVKLQISFQKWSGNGIIYRGEKNKLFRNLLMSVFFSQQTATPMIFFIYVTCCVSLYHVITDCVIRSPWHVLRQRCLFRILWFYDRYFWTWNKFLGCRSMLQKQQRTKCCLIFLYFSGKKALVCCCCWFLVLC